ncbi:MAG TPA: hypothetical protein VLH75_12510 [Longimicrobiales bacterium]|nr:hypothetical protein [Longimicrobiales bacterium]
MLSFPRLALIVVPAIALASPARGQTGEVSDQKAAAAAKKPDSRGVQIAKLMGGMATGLAIHEAGHLMVGSLVGADFHLKKVDFKGLPFFAIAHAPNLSPRAEYAVSSAGLWMQYVASERILSAHPNLRSERRRFEEGVLAFHVGVSVMYAGAAFAESGPYERDTRGAADALGVSERWMGPLVLAPAVLDAYRYAHPDAGWAAWASRGLKLAMVGMTMGWSR